MRYLLLLLVTLPVCSLAQCKIDTIQTPAGKRLPSVLIETEAGKFLIAKDSTTYRLFYTSANYSSRRVARETPLGVKSVTFHFLDRTLISFKCHGTGRANKNYLLSIQYTALQFEVELSEEEFEKLTSKRITTFSVTGELGSTGGDVIYKGYRQDIMNSFYCLNTSNFYNSSTIPSQASSIP